MVLDKMGGLIVQTEPKLSQAWGEEEENKVIVRIDKGETEFCVMNA